MSIEHGPSPEAQDGGVKESKSETKEQRIATPESQKELAEKVAEEMGLSVRFEPNKDLADIFDVIFSGTNEQAEEFINKVMGEEDI